MKRIIFGGSFDPVHLGHIEIALSAMKQIDADYVHFVPASKVSYKKLEESGVHRYELLTIALKDHHYFILEDYEILRNEPVYSIETLNYLKQKYDPQDEWYLLIGNDQLINFNKWKDYREILTKARLLVFQRDWKLDFKKVVEYNAIFIKHENIDISSSLFKKTFDKQLLNADVFQYIINHGFYHQSLLLKYMTSKRYAHSLRVATMMSELFSNHGSEKQHLAYLTGLYHDFCKCFDKEKLEDIAYNYMHLMPTNYKLLHGPVASYYLFSVFNVKYFDVLNAIARHTKPYDFGIGELSDLDKAIFCCDKLEPLRTNDDVENIDYFRELLNKNIDQCFHELLQAINKQYEH